MRLWSNSSVPGAGSFVPEKRLFVAVLQRAVADFLGGEDDISEEAGAWIASDDEDDDEIPLTFMFICEALDLDFEALRNGIFSQRTERDPRLQAAAV